MAELPTEVMPKHHIAQVNIGRLLAPLDDPMIAGFVALLDEINALAEGSPGFVWRLKTDEGNATDLRPYDDDHIIVNMSVWESIEQLKEYVYRSAHAEVLKRRREWFEKFDGAFVAMWWVEAGHTPTVEEAKQRLDHLYKHGESEFAFSFRKPFPPPTP
jgi:heme-degrading monooxygenase HmoA